KDVLIVEDIVDTGQTLTKVKNLLLTRNPNSLKVVTLLDKPSNRKVKFKPDYVGFEIKNEFVVGFGFDYDEKLRNLPYIGILKKEN
ncbi:hypoxanthine phosphoribosyltransferase, partial [Metamycoplasma hyosynoviae]